MVDSVEKRALKIAAAVMQRAGLCRYDSYEKCRKIFVYPGTCEKCIRNWLLNKARAELKREASGDA